VEELEDRLAPATLTVNSIADTASDSDPYLSLREAIAIVNSTSLPTDLSAQIRGQISGTLHGGGSDSIGFDHTQVTGPIVLGGSQLELSLQGGLAAVTISGGSGITVDGNDASQVFLVDYGVQATLDHLTITHGNAILGNGDGGGIFNYGTLTVSNSTLSANSASDVGGGIVNIETLTLSNCTLSGNSASEGGALFNNGPATVSNCTFSGNSANQGGGILNQNSLTLTNCTLTGNSAAGDVGGGLYVVDVFSPSVLRNTLVAGNVSPNGTDIYGVVDSSSSNNLVGSADGTLSGISNGTNGNLLGTRVNPINPRLGPLADNGGPTLTHALLADSPARGAGNVAFATTTDQRGQPRTVGGEIDLGAYQTQTAVTGPLVVASDPNGPTTPPVSHVRLTFNHPMDSTTMTTAQFTLTGPGGSIALTGVTAVSGTANQQFDVSFAAQSQLGDYALVVSAAVRDVHGTSAGNPFTVRFTLHALGSSLLTVNSTADTAHDSDPYLSLREAIAILNSPTVPTDLSPQIQAQISGTLHGGDDHIVFAPTLAGATIVLSGRQLELSEFTGSVTIDGGSAGVTVNGNDASRVLVVDSGVQATLAHLTLTHGTASFGGGILELGTLALNNCTLSSNSALAVGFSGGAGGGIFIDHGTLTITGSTLESNAATYSGGGIEDAVGPVTMTGSTIDSNITIETGTGGGISADRGVTLSVSNCTFTANTAGNPGGAIYLFDCTGTVANCTFSANSGSDGGALYNDGATLTVSNCTFSSNSVMGRGGAIENGDGMLTLVGCAFLSNSSGFFGGAISNSGTLTVSNCTLSGNSTTYDGGAIGSFSDTVVVFDCTLSANVAQESGGALYSFSPSAIFFLLNSIVAGNTSPSGPDISGFVDSSSSYSLVGDGTGATGISNGVNHNQVGTTANPIDPLLTPLGWYGGPTQTFALLPGSPARQAGNPAYAGGYDQRGQLAAFPGPIDIGAFQTQTNPFLVTTLTDPGRQFGLLSLREAVNLADALPGDNTVSFATTFDSGTVTLTQGQLELSGSSGVRTIDGGNRITLDANHASRLFLVDAGIQAVLTRLAIGNGSADAGGGIFNSGTLTLAACTLFGNAAILGGAIYNAGTLTMSGSTAAFNFAYYQGGGLDSEGQATVFNCTFADNTALDNGGALAIIGGSATLTSLTISLNLAASGGGVAVAAGAVLLRNCIVAGNHNDPGTAASDIAGTVSASSSYNLIGSGGSGGLSDGSNHNHVGVADPGLIPPDFSTVLSPVFGFTSSSPALGAGDPSLLSDPLLRLDQHGNTRNNPPNIGAL
jgi:hypothetical protein